MRVTQADTVIARDDNEVEQLRKLGRKDYIEFTPVALAIARRSRPTSSWN